MQKKKLDDVTKQLGEAKAQLADLPKVREELAKVGVGEGQGKGERGQALGPPGSAAHFLIACLTMEASAQCAAGGRSLAAKGAMTNFDIPRCALLRCSSSRRSRRATRTWATRATT